MYTDKEIKLIEGISKTWNTGAMPSARRAQIANACLGIVGELAEYLLEKSIDELGDVNYYRVALLSTLQMPVALSYDVDSVYMPSVALEAIANLAGVGKKLGFHNKPFDDEKVMRELAAGIIALNHIIVVEIDVLQTSLDDVVEFNLAKLEKRHGDSFNPQAN